MAIVDDALQPVPVGIEGQIVSAADDPITMLEYWERPEATARRIVDGWCLTGDRGSIDADGFLWYRGRMGLAMKVAGQVIGPEELEAVLLSHPAVAEVCVFAEPDPVLRDRPAAIVELVSDHRASPELVCALQDLARAHLARFAYPRRVLFEPIVRHPNGKIDRRGTTARYREA